MDSDIFTEASLLAIKAGCFVSLLIMLGKKLLKDIKS